MSAPGTMGTKGCSLGRGPGPGRLRALNRALSRRLNRALSVFGALLALGLLGMLVLGASVFFETRALEERGRLAAVQLAVLAEAAMRLTGLSKTTIHRRYRAGTFPRPVRLGPQSIGWRREEVLEWLESLPRAGGAAHDGGEHHGQAR